MEQYPPLNGLERIGRIIGRATLYVGLNGRRVERLRVDTGETFILKPLTSDGRLHREGWVYKHVLPSFPPVYPKLAAASPEGGASDQSWMLFEDLGELDHTFSEESAKKLIAKAAQWHSLPVSRWDDAPLQGAKPGIEQMVKELAEFGTEAAEAKRCAKQEGRGKGAAPKRLAAMLGVSAASVALAFERWEEEGLSPERVMCHGDLHLGNYALIGGDIKILDWEHAHPNHPYWDLYHIIDLSHPSFPKAMTDPVRERLLNDYIEQRANDEPVGEPLAFKRGYYLFSSMFSLWMLKLIASDLARGSGPWSVHELERQQAEVRERFEACARKLA